MKPWWERWPGRLEAELERFEALGLAFALDDDERTAGRIVLRGRLQHAGKDVDLSVVYPDSFPHMRVEVYAPSESLTRHQNPFEKNLCVLPRGAAFWRPSDYAADVVADQVPKLLDLLDGDPDALLAAEVPQGEPVTDYFPYLANGAVLIPAPLLEIPPDAESGTLTVRFRDSAEWLERAIRDEVSDPPQIGQAMLARAADGRGVVVAVADEVLLRVFPGATMSGRWVRLPNPLPLDSPKSVVDAALARLQIPRQATRGSYRSHGREPWLFEIIGVLFPEEVRQTEFQDSWLLFVVGVEKLTRGAASSGAFIRALRYSPDDLGVRTPELAHLRLKTVSLVGLGSLGAPVAMELAKAQTGRLKLMDYDFADPAASVRWPNGIEAAGVPKALFLQEHLSANYPYTQTEGFQWRLGTVTSNPRSTTEADRLDDWLDNADLVIDCAADENAARLVAYEAYERGLPEILCYSVDGFGGIVARFVPGQTGCILCLDRALAENRIAPPPAAANAGALRIQPRGCADETFTAAAPDLAPLSNQATRCAFSMLAGGAANGYPPFSDDVFVLQMREPDGALVAPRWRSYQLPRDPDCPLCSEH